MMTKNKKHGFLKKIGFISLKACEIYEKIFLSYNCLTTDILQLLAPDIQLSENKYTTAWQQPCQLPDKYKVTALQLQIWLPTDWQLISFFFLLLFDN